MTNRLYYGDNLSVLCEHVADGQVDLIYLDPPFNSNANYNILFKSPEGHDSDAQDVAFEDIWHWNDVAEEAYGEVRQSGNTQAFELLSAFRPSARIPLSAKGSRQLSLRLKPTTVASRA